MDEAPERPAKQFKCDDDTPVNRPPFANPSEEWLRRDRINRAIQSGQQPDPADVAEEGGEKIRYQRRVAEAHSEKIKDALSPEPSESKGKPSPADREPAMPLASSPSADPAGDITP